jgi:hypothetical protein
VAAPHRYLSRHVGGAIRLVLYDRQPPAGRRGPRRRALLLATPALAVLIGVTILLAATPRSEQQTAAACPAGLTHATASDGYVVQVSPERNPVGLLLLHLCTDPSAEAVRQWSLAGTSRTATDREIAVVRVGQRAALAAEALAPDDLIRLTITVVTASGRERRLTAVADL